MFWIAEKHIQSKFYYELEKRGFKILSQVGPPVIYDGMKINFGYGLDIFVEDSIIVEPKRCGQHNTCTVQGLLSYLKLSRKYLELPINFNVVHLEDGITRKIN